MASSGHRNRLASESSAYLLQHAGNPVDWYPWGDEALDLARRLDRPILLSVGYSACHWCHVMERETFENEEIAALMNASFVCIKVDREERPDVDHLYMKALQGMTGRGGWPMTMFLTPDARPFYGGTYFPPEDRRGMPGFPRVLAGVARAFAEKRDEVLQSAQRMVEYLQEERSGDAGLPASAESLLAEAAASLADAMDGELGGFGRAPKFPATMALSLMLDAAAHDPSGRFAGLVKLSLDRMASGGMRDHLGGGFHRYSVDREWLVPHFEKMLYDQALMAGLYVDGARFFGEPRYAGVAAEVLEYVLREMTSPEGGFYSAEDADSEGVEGKFFVWSKAEILEVLGAERGEAFATAYGVTDDGNFEGANILHRPGSAAATSREADAGLAACRAALLERRRQRVAPAIDRKILTDWNALVIGALARAGQALDRPDFVEAAERAAAFVRSTLDAGKGLRHVHAAGESKVAAFLDDHALLGRASLDLFVVRPRAEHLEAAIRSAEVLLAEFAAGERGGFFFTRVGGEGLVARTCDLHDGAVPAGNSAAADLFLRLWTLTGRDEFRRAGEGIIERFLPEARRHPYGASLLLAVACRHLAGEKLVVVVGERDARERLSRAARRGYDPRRTVVAIEEDEAAWLPAGLSGKKAPGSGAVAYVCEAGTCSLPIASEAELRERLGIESPEPRPGGEVER